MEQLLLILISVVSSQADKITNALLFNDVLKKIIILDCTAPFRVGITTDSVATDDGTPMAGMNRGVCLEYTQKPC